MTKSSSLMEHARLLGRGRGVWRALEIMEGRELPISIPPEFDGHAAGLAWMEGQEAGYLETIERFRDMPAGEAERRIEAERILITIERGEGS